VNISEEITRVHSRRAILVGLALPGELPGVVDEHLDELGELAASAGVTVVGREIQRRRAPDPAHFVGRGKAEELKEIAGRLEADLVLFDDDLSPSQVKNLETTTDLPVMDRSALILEIFRQRARTREARTQVELAQLNYMLPRLTRKWQHLGRQAGGIGVRGGEGETQLEADRRMLRRRIQRLEKELEKIERTRDTQRRGRSRTPVVSLAGYTNAGKSTLFNRLTDDGDAQAEDRLFATLDARLRRGTVATPETAQTSEGEDPAAWGDLDVAWSDVDWDTLDWQSWQGDPERLLGDKDGAAEGAVVFADTVGFIRKLPHHLVSSFRSTLGGIAESDLVLHVIDRSHPRWREQMEVAEEVLGELGVEEGQAITVFNKSDRLAAPAPPEDRDLDGKDDTFWVSALSGDGLAALREAIAERLAERRPHAFGGSR
jgi:GTP-binding protein HflX